MGIRSMNYIALQPGIVLTDAVSEHINTDRAEILSDERGTLVVFESNFTPMLARDGRGEMCTCDLEAEVTLHRFLGTLQVESFYMKRAGEMCDHRGQWVDHAFTTHDTVLEIEADFLEATEKNAFSEQPDLSQRNRDLADQNRALRKAIESLVSQHHSGSWHSDVDKYEDVTAEVGEVMAYRESMNHALSEISRLATQAMSSDGQENLSEFSVFDLAEAALEGGKGTPHERAALEVIRELARPAVEGEGEFHESDVLDAAEKGLLPTAAAMTDVFSCFVNVAGVASDVEDEGVQGTYEVMVTTSVPVTLSRLTADQESAVAKSVLDQFHAHQGIEYLDDFEIAAYLENGLLIVETGRAPKSTFSATAVYSESVDTLPAALSFLNL